MGDPSSCLPSPSLPSVPYEYLASSLLLMFSIFLLQFSNSSMLFITTLPSLLFTNYFLPTFSYSPLEGLSDQLGYLRRVLRSFGSRMLWVFWRWGEGGVGVKSGQAAFGLLPDTLRLGYLQVSSEASSQVGLLEFKSLERALQVGLLSFGRAGWSGAGLEGERDLSLGYFFLLLDLWISFLMRLSRLQILPLSWSMLFIFISVPFFRAFSLTAPSPPSPLLSSNEKSLYLDRLFDPYSKYCRALLVYSCSNFWWANSYFYGSLSFWQ